LKNDFGEKSDSVLDNACKKLRANSYESINEIIKKEKLDTICIVPRAKREAYYNLISFCFLLQCDALHWILE
ncbi:hypothetical protein KZ378_08995, partial [Glaesserella parasuis]|nr:hypothetical protein [Glaesserella parasuis]